MEIMKSHVSAPKNALITGASKRIGAAIARSLAARGTNIVVHYFRSKKEAESLCMEIRGLGVNAVVLPGDLKDPQACRALFAEARKKLGTIDLLVNNASVFEPDSVREPDDALWASHFAVHLHAPVVLASAMAAQDDLLDGLIINMIDQRVKNLNPMFFSYTLSKSALWTATQTMAQELAPHIRVNGIGPGPTLANKRQDADDFARQVKGLLLKHGPDLEEFGDTIAWLWRSKSVTGQMIALDGGQHLAWQTPDVDGVRE